MEEFLQILSDREHKGKINLQICIKKHASFSLNHCNVSFGFLFSIWKHTRLNCFYPLSITENVQLPACVDDFNS